MGTFVWLCISTAIGAFVGIHWFAAAWAGAGIGFGIGVLLKLISINPEAVGPIFEGLCDLLGAIFSHH